MLDREAQGLEVILHCFSMPDRLDECLERGWWISFAGNVTYPKAQDLAAGGRARPARPPAGRDRRAVPDAAGAAQAAQPAGLRRPHRPLRRRAPRDRLRGARGGRRGQRRPAVRLVSDLPAQPSLRRMKAFGIRPNRDLGPELPDRLEPARGDLARRRGRPGRRRARGRRRPRRAVRAPRRARRATCTSSSSTAGSRRRCATPPTRTRTSRCTSPTPSSSTSRALDPAPTKVVANLPYGVAATVILRTLEKLPERDDVGRDGAEGGRRALRRRRRARPPTGSRACSPSSRPT